MNGDFSVPVLARLNADDDPAPLLAWVQAQRQGLPPARLHGGGLASAVAGLGHAMQLEPRLRPVAEAARDRLVQWTRQAVVPQHVYSHDYDIVSGMSGVVLALASFPRATFAHIEPAVTYLLALCSGDLSRLRHGWQEPSPDTAWNAGHYNHGLAHGLPGVLAALLTAYPLGVEKCDELAAAIGLLAHHLDRAATFCSRGVITWGRGDLAESVDGQRQAWCYGTPGVAWQLAEAGRLLEEPALTERALAAMASLCWAWDSDLYFADDPSEARSGFCHGLPGLLTVADAFSVHYGLREATDLCRHLVATKAAARSDSVTFLAGSGGACLAGQRSTQVRWQMLAGLR
ncbi:lanthionine synthetase LanC family protein [Catelliglobosispora koreensis]|uniref:lanthionine synthetase LanC family protein n=1 Tax=Catelliglobosispora koreensis TaxID=129052 RepID=UPI00039ED94E|nr:lanthionine synthetase LanC family protein [Catelliglobosispora koreensis]